MATPLKKPKKPVDALSKLLAAAPVDDEVFTEEQRSAAAEGQAEIKSGKGLSTDEVRRLLEIP